MPRLERFVIISTERVCRFSLTQHKVTVDDKGNSGARFFDDARGSATECAACLDVLVAKSLCTIETILTGKQLFGRIVAMLSKLVTRFSSQSERYEDSEEYGRRIEDDDDE